MSQTYIPKALRDLIVVQAHHRCGYCLTAEAVIRAPVEGGDAAVASCR